MKSYWSEDRRVELRRLLDVRLSWYYTRIMKNHDESLIIIEKHENKSKYIYIYIYTIEKHWKTPYILYIYYIYTIYTGETNLTKPLVFYCGRNPPVKKMKEKTGFFDFWSKPPGKIFRGKRRLLDFSEV